LDSEERQIQRSRASLFLLLGAAASLIIPLLALLFWRLADVPAVPMSSSARPFARRESQADRIRAAAAPAPAVAPAQATPAFVPNRVASKTNRSGTAPTKITDSLGFVKADTGYYTKKVKATQPVTKPAAPAKTPKLPAKPKRTKPAAKTFIQPKLSGTDRQDGFADFRNKQSRKAGTGQPQTAPTPDVGAMLQSIPGAGNLLRGLPTNGGESGK
jgi:hypothetical protein